MAHYTDVGHPLAVKSGCVPDWRDGALVSPVSGSGNPKFDALIAEIVQLHAKKNHDYSEQGDPLSNFKRAERLGITPFLGVLVRMTDKWSRIEELVKGKTPKNESLRDSLVDNAVYSLLAVLLLDEAAR